MIDKTFDEAYARYLTFLAQLDKTSDMAEKNHLFRRLTEQLAELEKQLQSSQASEPAGEESEITNWI